MINGNSWEIAVRKQRDPVGKDEEKLFHLGFKSGNITKNLRKISSEAF